MITPKFFTPSAGLDAEVRRREGGHAVVAPGSKFAVELTTRPSDAAGQQALRVVVRGRDAGPRGGADRPTWRLWSLAHLPLGADEAAEVQRDLAGELADLLRAGHSLYDALQHCDDESRRLRRAAGVRA